MNIHESRSKYQNQFNVKGAKPNKTDLGNVKVENRPEHMFKNGAKYIGQWLKDSDEIRHGKGRQTWPDGACYEGMWVYNKANG